MHTIRLGEIPRKRIPDLRLLYVENLIQKIEKKSSDGVENINKLPHRRYDKFFDSLGPTGIVQIHYLKLH
nr:CLL_HP1_G0004470.mRNA.1.CDS.1 [Saccharomyces cerevisiae]